MFKKSAPSSQSELFSGILERVGDKKSRILEDSSEWHNVFYQQVTSQIDEAPFSILFSTRGRPNAPIRRLIAMMILKEGHGWSDEQLFEQCQFNLRVMRSLGLQNLDEEAPCSTTYYDFRKRLDDHFNEYGEDLFEQSFRQITSQQIEKFKIMGSHLRMDSKLIHSNIAATGRLQLIVSVIRKFYSSLDKVSRQLIKKKYDRELLEEILLKQPTNIVYGLGKEEKTKKLLQLGHLIRKLLNIYTSAHSEHYETLQRLYEEQYIEDQEDTDIRPPKEIGSESLQSVHDTEATYRSKGQGHKKQLIAGYHSNITETCEEQPINLIVDVQFDKANINESDFLVPALNQSSEVLNQAIDVLVTDGGFDSRQNRSFICSQTDSPDWYFSKNKGMQYTFELSKNKQGELQVKDLKTNEYCEVEFQEDRARYRVKTLGRKSKNRYLTQEYVDSYFELIEIRKKQKDDKFNLRPNVESTIHQMFHRLGKNNKSSYRGLFKNKIYAFNRALWVNCSRIKAAIIETFIQNSYLFIYKMMLKLKNKYIELFESIFQKRFNASNLIPNQVYNP